MNNQSKIYKNLKIKHFLKHTDLIFFFHTVNINSNSWLKIEQYFFKNNLKYYRIQNSISRTALKNSIFSNYLPVINGSVCLVTLKKNSNININFKELYKIDVKMPILSLKLNKKIYSNIQLKNLTTLNYNKNVIIMNKTFKKLLKTPYYKLKNISK